ncbi:hypothetical protein WR25_18319 [Diploscapter pachys]|uniref:Armadillo repeat-containing domain-containing protein n=1 Tax=Diploscapter pachys TaxID=2018661 RepID=A0A2A2L0H6_9BILA|nr:hypothetical protein WR25_18319 [Diploscapter pachys]
MEEVNRGLAAPYGAGFDGQVCSPYDSQIPSTSSINTAPNTPQRCNTPISQQQSPYRQTVHNNGNGPLSSDRDRLALLRESQTNRMAHTNQWMMDTDWGGDRGRRDANNMNNIPPHYREYRNAPSVISRLSHVTGASQASQASSHFSPLSTYSLQSNCYSELSVNTQLSNDFALYAPYGNQMNVLSISSASSSVENHRPAIAPNSLVKIDSTVEKYTFGLENPNLTLDQRVCVIRDIEREINAKSTGNRTVFDMANRDKLKQLITQLFLQLRIDYSAEVIRHLFKIITHFLHKAHQNVQMAEMICEIHKEFIRCNTNFNCQTGLIFLLYSRLKIGHTVYTDRCLWVLCTLLNIKAIFRKSAREQPGLVEVILEHLALKESTVDEKKFAADCLKLLTRIKDYTKMNILKQRIVANGGIEKLLTNLEYNEDEKVLYAVLTCLSEFLSHSFYLDKFIEVGGVQRIARLLPHGSSRILHIALSCMCQSSYRPTIANQDVSEAISLTIRLIGANDLIINQHATTFLMNVGYHSPKNKATIVTSRGIETVLNFLPMLENFFNQIDYHYDVTDLRKRVTTIQLNILFILVILTDKQAGSGYPDEHVKMALQLIIQMCHLSCKFFVSMIACSDSIEIYRHSALLIKRCLEFDANFAIYFLDITDPENVLLPTRLLGRAKQMFEILRMHNANMQYQNKSQLDMETQRRNGYALEFIYLSFDILFHLSKNSMMAQRLAQILRENNPLTLLSLTEDASIWHMIIEFCCIFSQQAPNSTVWLYDQISMNYLNKAVNQQKYPNMAQFARKTLQFLENQLQVLPQARTKIEDNQPKSDIVEKIEI